MQYVTTCKHDILQRLYELYFMFFNYFFDAFQKFPPIENFFDLLLMLLFIASAQE